MTIRILTDSERALLQNALWAAAAEYDAIANRMQDAKEYRMAEQFDQQAKHTRQLSAALEDAGEISLTQ
jgi:hypothetical protein